MHYKYSLVPVINNTIRILILGSLPGDTSLLCKQYYAHPQNKFWKLISAIINVDITICTYQMKLDTLLKNSIGLWDVIAQAKRKGSLDNKIYDYTNNNLISLLNKLPYLVTIGFNGSTATRIGMKILKNKKSQYKIISLPSSSAAYTIPYSYKLSTWMCLINK